MKCTCGYETPAELAAQNEGRCASCGGPVEPDPIELLSCPALGLVEEIRAGQVEYARAFVEMLDTPGNACGVFQAGCGIGKTFAYGVPAVLRPTRVVIATGKKSLQDQLAKKDLPFMQQVFGRPKHFVTMKGKSNYVCRWMLEKNEGLFRAQGQMKLHAALTTWAADTTHAGDLDTFPGQLEFPASTCTADECVKCSYGDKGLCGYRRRRAELPGADVVIINHALLGYVLRYGATVIGPFTILIVDEAHVAPGFIRNAFSQDLSETWLRHYINRLQRDAILHFTDAARDAIEDRWAALFAQLPTTKMLPVGVLGAAGHAAVTDLETVKAKVHDYLASRWGHETEDGEVDLETIQLELLNERDRGNAAPLRDFYAVTKQLDKLLEKRQTILDTYETDDNYILSQEDTNTGRKRVLRQPVNLAPITGPKFAGINKVLFTSATLSAETLAAELGLQPRHVLSVPSPFPYQRSLVYLPKHLPRPDDPKWHNAIADEVVQLVRASGGNALVLFSSMNDLREIRRIVDTEYELEYPLLAQGDGRRAPEVFDEFMHTERAVLFGSKSFFEGIDVQGEKLSLVIIPKLPFPSPDDPLTKAKSERLGSGWFAGWSYPQMQQDVQQAAGRLIRTRDDRGVVAILDVRIWVGGNREIDPQDIGTKKLWRGYGYQLVKSLPFPNWSPRRELVFEYFKMLRAAA